MSVCPRRSHIALSKSRAGGPGMFTNPTREILLRRAAETPEHLTLARSPCKRTRTKHRVHRRPSYIKEQSTTTFVHNLGVC